ncbi:MAG: hypothetical protein GVY36_16965 [Verrucomicrobia bacterium]|nr:hypothetical protein [Verrucomicrobiota bacterium]
MKEFEDLTSDHAFPQASYTNTTPPNLEKWQAPCCAEYNGRLSKIEEELLTRIGLCIDPDAPECAGIADKVLRSVNPAYGRNERDKRSREAKFKRIARGLKPLSSEENRTLVALSPDPSGPLVEINDP